MGCGSSVPVADNTGTKPDAKQQPQQNNAAATNTNANANRDAGAGATQQQRTVTQPQQPQQPATASEEVKTADPPANGTTNANANANANANTTASTGAASTTNGTSSSGTGGSSASANTTGGSGSGFSLETTIEVAASADLTWQVVGDWLLNYLKGYSTDIKVTHRDNTGVVPGGCHVRIVEIPKVGTVEEKLLSLNNEKRFVSYVMTQTATLPYKDYSVELRVESAGPNVSQVIWKSTAGSSVGDPTAAKLKAEEGLTGAVFVMRSAVKQLQDQQLIGKAPGA